MHSRRWLALLTLLIAPTLTHAQSRITVSRVIPYHEGVGSDALRTQCDWNTRLSAELVTDTHGQVVATDQDLAMSPGATLHMSIVNVHAIGGGHFSGPKWAELNGELRDHGKLLGSFTARRQTSRGFSACSSLDHVGKAIAEDVASWLKAPVLDAHL
ncbi:hypothetical protein ACPPVV_10780 [Rhodanobacter sp. Col0626]|uniref:hypothetical protein n=1 Tax=Rhodanobacter sp. Col0626 TaxID=3415679 RepID=UPI003CE7DA33